MAQPLSRALCRPAVGPADRAAVAARAGADSAAPRSRCEAFKVTGNTLLDARSRSTPRWRPTRASAAPTNCRRAAAALQARYREAGYGAVVAFVPEQAADRSHDHDQRRRRHASRRSTSAATSSSATPTSAPACRRWPSGRRRACARSTRRSSSPTRTRPSTSRCCCSRARSPARSRRSIAGHRAAGQPLQHRPGQQRQRQHRPAGAPTSAISTRRCSARDHVLALQLQVAPEKLECGQGVSANYRVPLYAQAHGDRRLRRLFRRRRRHQRHRCRAAAVLRPRPHLRAAREQVPAALRRVRPPHRRRSRQPRLHQRLQHRRPAAGACGNAGESVSVQPMAIEYVLHKGGENRFGASIGLQHNLQLGGAQQRRCAVPKVRPGSEPRYTALRFGLFGAFALPEDWQLQARLVGQATRRCAGAGRAVRHRRCGVGARLRRTRDHRRQRRRRRCRTDQPRPGNDGRHAQRYVARCSDSPMPAGCATGCPRRAALGGMPNAASARSASGCASVPVRCRAASMSPTHCGRATAPAATIPARISR